MGQLQANAKLVFSSLKCWMMPLIQMIKFKSSFWSFFQFRIEIMTSWVWQGVFDRLRHIFKIRVLHKWRFNAFWEQLTCRCCCCCCHPAFSPAVQKQHSGFWSESHIWRSFIYLYFYSLLCSSRSSTRQQQHNVYMMYSERYYRCKQRFMLNTRVCIYISSVCAR